MFYAKVDKKIEDSHSLEAHMFAPLFFQLTTPLALKI
jgi:hypothetical protein